VSIYSKTTEFEDTRNHAISEVSMERNDVIKRVRRANEEELRPQHGCEDWEVNRATVRGSESVGRVSREERYYPKRC